ncbi:hypothetical protein [Methylobacterium iners]|jgi:hypothetical protein|uniref:Uncharacterized protein n=1 Tax=Methylobacterium iners TaxID=418707 RepID=A0ABQ4RY85_9HYPH|nr:hypothetical protein [Methylobacterium iners]GJD95811.1 hypothetical protein OCOJLMKI_3026 [Methylobacterium iners]
MTDETRRPSLKDFDAYTDRNGDVGQEDARDVGIAARTQADLRRDPMAQAEAARWASGTPRQDATDATEAETPPENLRRISDPTPKSTDAAEAIDRATAAVGKDEDE